MTATLRLKKPGLDIVSKYSTWLILWGIALAILGVLAIGAATLTTLITVFLLGIFITIGGIVLLIDTFSFWWGRWGGFLMHLLLAVLYLIAGIMLIEQPLIASISITLILGIAYTVIGIVRSINSILLGSVRWGWYLINGLITLLLGILILESWPESSLFIIGLFVGIDLLFTGIAYMVIGSAAKNVTA